MCCVVLWNAYFCGKIIVYARKCRYAVELSIWSDLCSRVLAYGHGIAGRPWWLTSQRVKGARKKFLGTKNMVCKSERCREEVLRNEESGMHKWKVHGRSAQIWRIRYARGMTYVDTWYPVRVLAEIVWWVYVVDTWLHACLRFRLSDGLDMFVYREIVSPKVYTH